MKKTILLLVATLFLTACSSDDDGGTSNNDSLIIGKWNLIALEKNNIDIPLTECELLQSCEFFANNTAISRAEDYRYEDRCDIIVINQEYSVSNGVLTTTEEEYVSETDYYDYEVSYYITALTSNTLELKLFYSREDLGGDEGETNYPESEQITFTYEREN